MKKPNYISPSALSLFLLNEEEYFTRYFCSDVPRVPQTAPMAVGSAFDAYIKNYLHDKIFGPDPEYSFEKFFETQVEPHNRDTALVIGKNIFEQYLAFGSVNDLLLELAGASSAPRFEFSLTGTVEHFEKQLGPVTLNGKPDIFYINSHGTHVIHDWKVNGYYSSASPKPGFVRIRPGGGSHKDSLLLNTGGMIINVASTLESVDEEWARQLSTYAWLLGENIGGGFIASIDQVVFSNKIMRVASHRSKISSLFQNKLFENYCALWKRINSEYFFDPNKDLKLRKIAGDSDFMNLMIPKFSPKIGAKMPPQG